MNLASRWGRIAKPTEDSKTIRVPLPNFHANLRWKLQCFFNDFEIQKQIPKVVESSFLHGSDTFEWRPSISLPESTFSCLGCRQLKKAYKKHWEFSFRICDVNISQEVSQKEHESQMAAHTKLQIEACRKTSVRRAKTYQNNTLLPTWMTIFLSERKMLYEKVCFSQRHSSHRAKTQKSACGPCGVNAFFCDPSNVLRTILGREGGASWPEFVTRLTF